MSTPANAPAGRSVAAAPLGRALDVDAVAELVGATLVVDDNEKDIDMNADEADEAADEMAPLALLVEIEAIRGILR